MTRLNDPQNALFIGWDVGGWNCERNANSRDALVVLDHSGELLGRPWRGNLRELINAATTTQAWVEGLLQLCEIGWMGALPPVVLAIDTPLAFSEQFQALINGEGSAAQIGESASNPYLFRFTERYLFERGLAPLSAIKDMIGSQATKGIHTLAKFAPERIATGVWQGAGVLTAFEAYPSACKQSAVIQQLLEPFVTEREVLDSEPRSIWEGAQFVEPIDHPDKRDALLCALIARLFVQHPDSLALPTSDAPPSEGWIFVPKDGLKIS